MTISTTLLLVMTAALSAATPGGEGRLPFLFPPINQLGSATAGTLQDFKLQATNHTGTTLSLRSITPACGCAKVEITPTTVEPGQVVQLIGSIKHPHYGATVRYSKAIVLMWSSSNEAEAKRETIRIAGTTKRSENATRQHNLPPSDVGGMVAAPTLARIIGTNAIPSERDSAIPDAALVGDSLTPQRSCPFRGLPNDPALFVTYNGQRIYTCCEPCLVIASTNPRLAIKLLREVYGERLMNDAEHGVWEKSVTALDSETPGTPSKE